MLRTAPSVLMTMVGFVALGSGCASTSMPQLPEGDVPETWGHLDVVSDVWPGLEWWSAFESEELQRIMALLEERNLNLANNARNLQLAQLNLRDAGFDLLPTPVVDFQAASAYSGSKPGSGGDYGDGGSESFSLGAGFVYADILSKPTDWAAARARYDSDVALAADVRLNTLGTAASTYFRVLLLRDLIEAAKLNVKNAEEITRIVAARVEAGTVNKIDLLQQQIAVQREKSNLESLRQDELSARASLAILLAESVNDIEIQANSLADIKVPEVVPGLPSSLLTRRPDIAQAESNLRVSRANVDLARLAFLPNISVSGSASLFSTSLSDLLSNGDLSVNATASVAQLIFDNGARSRNVERSRLLLESALADYRQTVISAFNEIEVALGNLELLEALGAVAETDLRRAEEAFRIAEARYREGVADYQTVLVSQTSLFSTRDNFLNNKLARLNALVAFYQSLGGGWEVP